MNNTHDTGAGPPFTFFDDNTDAGLNSFLEGLAYEGSLSHQNGFGQTLPFSQQHSAGELQQPTNSRP